MFKTLPYNVKTALSVLMILFFGSAVIFGFILLMMAYFNAPREIKAWWIISDISILLFAPTIVLTMYGKKTFFTNMFLVAVCLPLVPVAVFVLIMGNSLLSMLHLH